MSEKVQVESTPERDRAKQCLDFDSKDDTRKNNLFFDRSASVMHQSIFEETETLFETHHDESVHLEIVTDESTTLQHQSNLKSSCDVPSKFKHAVSANTDLRIEDSSHSLVVTTSTESVVDISALNTSLDQGLVVAKEPKSFTCANCGDTQEVYWTDDSADEFHNDFFSNHANASPACC